jgi:hypothetical protein
LDSRIFPSVPIPLYQDNPRLIPLFFYNVGNLEFALLGFDYITDAEELEFV